MLAEAEEVDGKPGHLWVVEVLAELQAMENVRLRTHTTVAGAYDQGTFAALKRVLHLTADRPDGAPIETYWRIAAKRSVLAAGALERPVGLRDNDRPGIMIAGVVRAYLNRWGVSPGRNVTIFGKTYDIHRTARDPFGCSVQGAKKQCPR